MKKKILLISFFILILVFNFGFFVLGEPIDINDISDKDFTLLDSKVVASVNDNHYLKLGFDKSIGLTLRDVSYKLIGDKENISSFLDCVDVKYNVVDGVIEFIGEVKKFGIYSVDIQPIIKNSLILDNYIWWNSTYMYRQSSCILNNVTNYAMMLNVSYSIGGDLAMNGHCQANFSDIRFVTKDNTTELYHWIEFQSNSNYAIFWINISDEDYINCYYGNDVSLGNSSYNNPVNVFYMWENFTSISDWTNYAGGGFTVYNGILVMTSTTSSFRMWKVLANNDYIIKTKFKCNSSDNSNAYAGFCLEIYLPASTWHSISVNEMWIQTKGTSNGLYHIVEGRDATGTYYSSSVNKPDSSTWYIGSIKYNNHLYIGNLNNYIINGVYATGMTNSGIYLTARTRNQATIITNYDWLFVGLQSSPEPSFCSWSIEYSYCYYSNYIINESPTDESIVSGINVSYITAELVVLDGEADSINISLVADNGFFYINDTTDVYNGTYSLNVMLANFTTETTYIYYVNITNGGCFVSYDFSFETVYFGGYTEFQILSYKINNIYEDMLKGDDEMNITIDIEVTLLFILLVLAIWLFFITKYYDTRNTMFCILQFGVSLPLFIIIASISLSYPFGFILVFVIPVISLYIFIDGIIYAKKKQKENR